MFSTCQKNKCIAKKNVCVHLLIEKKENSNFNDSILYLYSLFYGFSFEKDEKVEME